MVSATTMKYLLTGYAILLYETCSTAQAKEQPEHLPNGPLTKILLAKRDVPSEPCCLVQHCEEIDLETENHNAYQCYKREVCGDICGEGNYRRVPLPYSPHTPAYKIKQYYTKKECRFDQCVSYKFDCRRCPDPNTAKFSIYAIKEECVKCYY